MNSGVGCLAAQELIASNDVIMTELENYANTNLQAEISEIELSSRNDELKLLSVQEKAIIYKYSNDGYAEINEKLRVSKGKSGSEFGNFLNISLSKLENFEGLVYRGAMLTKKELKRYSHAFESDTLLTEYAFISTSKSKLIAMSFRGNVLFRMYSRTGKEIEMISKFGEHEAPNEREVLFRSNRTFRILEIREEQAYSLITMEEIR